MSQPIFPRLALVGIGLIGSSIALAARKAGAVAHIAIHSRSAETLARAEELGLGDSYHADAAGAVADADGVGHHRIGRRRPRLQPHEGECPRYRNPQIPATHHLLLTSCD